MEEEQKPAEEGPGELEFKDIVRLPNRDIQMILREISGKDVALALKGADEDLRDRVFGNVSKRVATMIRDEMKLQAAAKMHDVLEMRSVITTIARGLASSGAITWPPSARREQPPESEKRAAGRPHPAAAARPPRKRSTRRTAVQVAGGLASAAVLVALAVLLGRFSRGAQPGGGTSAERRQAGAPAGQAAAPTAPAGQAQSNPSAQPPGEAPAKAAAAGTEAAAGTPGEAAQTGTREGAAPERQAADAPETGPATPLVPGARLETEGRSTSAFRLPDGAANLEVEPNSSLLVAPRAEAGEAEEAPPRLDLRLGNVRVDVTDPALEVSSPVAKVTATEGAAYRIRVVLDAATTVTVESGIVWLKPTARGETGTVVLQAGDEAHVSPTGRVSVEGRK